MRYIFPWSSKGVSSPESKPGRAHRLHSHIHTILCVRLKGALLLLHEPCKLLLLHQHHGHRHESCKRLMLLLRWLPLLLRLFLGRNYCPSGLVRRAILLDVLLVIVSDQANRAGGCDTVHVGGFSSVAGVSV